jgi:hypothetical protein
MRRDESHCDRIERWKKKKGLVLYEVSRSSMAEDLPLVRSRTFVLLLIYQYR